MYMQAVICQQHAMVRAASTISTATPPMLLLLQQRHLVVMPQLLQLLHLEVSTISCLHSANLIQALYNVQHIAWCSNVSQTGQWRWDSKCELACVCRWML